MMEEDVVDEDVIEAFFNQVEICRREGQVITDIVVDPRWMGLFNREVWPEMLSGPRLKLGAANALTWKGAMVYSRVMGHGGMFQIIALKATEDRRI